MDSALPETMELAQWPYQTVPFWQRNAAVRHAISMLEVTAARGSAADVPYLARLIRDKEDRVATAALTAATRIIARATPEDLTWLDAHMRSYGLYGTWFGGVTPGHLTQISATDGHAWAIIALASMHDSGYVRSAAVQHLAGVWDGRELPYLLIRVNDWVPSVRTAAEVAVRERIRPDYASHFLHNLALVMALEHQGRGDHSPLVEAVLALLGDAGDLQILRDILYGHDRASRRLAFRVLLGKGALTGEEMAELALASADTSIRGIAINCIVESLGGTPLRAFLEHALTARIPAVRVEALMALWRRFPEQSHQALHAALLDGNSTVRETARYCLRRLGETDFAAVYRAALARNPTPAAVAGLGETISRANADELVPYAAGGEPRVRREALRALARLDSDSHVDVFVEALRDSNTSVSRSARLALTATPRHLYMAAVAPLVSPDQPGHVRRNALLLIGCLPLATALPGVLACACDADAGIAEIARNILERRLMFLSPYPLQMTPEQHAAIGNALRRCAGYLSERLQERVDTLLAIG